MAPAYKTAEEFPHPPGTITLREAAERTGLTMATLDTYCYQHYLGYIKLYWRYGRSVRFARYIPLQDLYLFMASRAYTKLYRRTGKKVEYHPATRKFEHGRKLK